jgi:hypothetical protein
MCVQNMCVRMYTNFLLFWDNLLKLVVGFCELLATFFPLKLLRDAPQIRTVHTR